VTSLFETPFPVLLNTILREERTCTLELRLRQLEKKIVFEEGAPVACSSNLLHETLGKYLVEKGKLTEAQYQAALAESITTGRPMGELLVQKQLVAPFELYRHLQANLAHKILDAFRWSEGTYRIVSGGEASDSALRMNSAQLILTGTSNLLPFDVVATHLTFSDDQRFAAVHEPPPAVAELKLSGRNARFLQVLKGRPTFAELMAQTELEVEPALRKLYALVVLGLADLAENVPERAPVRAAPAPAPAPAPSPAPVPAFLADEDAATRDALMAAFLEHRSKDPFSLLGVPEDAQPAAIRQTFLKLADRFAPVRFATPELREKAETLLVAWARAFALLIDPEQNALWKQRRRAAEERRRSEVKPSTAEQFRIRTDLLDARSQFDQARERLAANNPRAAMEYFEYACDIDPRPQHRAWRAWCRYLMAPDRHARLALEELTALCREEGATDEAFGFAGEIHRKLGQYAEAEACFRRAFKLNPQNRAWADAIPQVLKALKR
jgi:tetratricopeptide (TPR) repeat protein